MYTLKNTTKNVEVSKNVIVANSFFKRLKGLMFTKEFPQDSTMYISPCRQIHTFFMNYAIDVLYLDKDNVILDVDENIKPGRIGKKVKGTVSVVELPANKIRKLNMEIGHSVQVSH
jgi:uncharacterized membrane protein (UPF0127 family)